MIRINLLPVKTTRPKQVVQQQLIAFVGVFLITIISCVTWWRWTSNKEEQLHKEVKDKQQEIAQLDKIIGEVNEFTSRKQELEEKLKVINQLKKGKTGPVRALDELASEIPKRVWLKSMVENNGKMDFEGSAIDLEDVSAFMKVLDDSDYFDQVVLVQSTSSRDSKTGLVFYKFKITANVNYSV